MAGERFEGTSPPKPDTDSAYTSLSSLLKPSRKKAQQGGQQKLVAPTPRRQGNHNRPYTVSERSEAGSSRNSPNPNSRDTTEHDGQLVVGEDRRSRSRSPGAGNQAPKKKCNTKKSVWSLIALTISMGGAQVSQSPLSFAQVSDVPFYPGGLGGRVGLWDTLSAGSRSNRTVDFTRMAGGSQ